MLETITWAHVHRIEDQLEELLLECRAEETETRNLSYLRDIFVEGLNDGCIMDVRAWRNAIHCWYPWWNIDVEDI